MKSCIKSFFLIIFLLAIMMVLYMFANPSTYYKATSKISFYVQTALENKNLSWMKNVFPVSNIQATSDTPILMYHHVKNHLESDDEVEQGLSVTLQNFSEQMQYLKDNGYNTISLDKLFSSNEQKDIVLTFDDGYKDVYTNAYPIMKKMGLTGTVFVITDFVGEDRYMSWDELKELDRAGWDIESHTQTHPNLTNTAEDEAWDQINESKYLIESKIRNSVKFFSYPAEQYNDETIQLVKKAGYTEAVSTEQGIDNNSADIYHLKRERVGGYSELQDFIGLIK